MRQHSLCKKMYFCAITPTSMQDDSFSKFSLLMKAYRYITCH